MTTSQHSEQSRFPIVGVVASAGGLDAFKQLLGAVPVDCGMAFVLVPHLDPKFESQMVKLLSKVSLLPVVKATQGMVVEANQVYVIPAGNFLTIDNGALQLGEPPTPQGRETAIDFFLRSLAKDQGERSVGIVLSGTGSHGTLGIRDIKLAGGMAIAQVPATAEFDSMPASIISEGLADYELPPAEMPATLMQYLRQPYIKHAPPSSSDMSVEDRELVAILGQVLKHTGYDFNSYRKNMMLRRIQRRMGLQHLERVEQYVERLKQDPHEAHALYRDLLISVTAFFRDPDAYHALRDQVRPEIASRDFARFPFRVWVPGCATGEEAYSLAMLLVECLDERPTTEPQPLDSSKVFQIFASDVDEVALTVARTGIYPSTIAGDVCQERLDRFFTKADAAHFLIGKQLRASIAFSKQNLIHDPPFSKLDLISCRNLLIYLEPEMQQKVISLFHFALSDDGILMLGPTESVLESDQLFEPISKKWRIFKKQNSNARLRLPLPVFAVRSRNGQNAMQSPALPPRNGYKEIVEKALISYYSPASVLVNRRYDVLYVTGPLVDYLEFPAGELSQNLLSMCRPGLRTRLRFACQKSVKEERDTQVTAQMKRGDETIKCSIQVRNLNTRHDKEPLLLVSFTDECPDDVLPPSVGSESGNEPNSSYAIQLERELKANSEELGGVIEELEHANEDLKTSNEEVMLMNEELQSANEELETSKEELQSLNEELSTVNLELLEKVTELDAANNDILNLLTSTEIATLFLDNEMLIQRFTPPTVQLLNVRSTDIGRPLGDITTRFIDENLLTDCRKVIAEGQLKESEIAGENSRMYLRRILPYRSQGDEVLGVVITFIDLTERLALENSLKESKNHLEAILDSASDAILTVNDDGIIARLNPATEILFGYPEEEMLGESVMSLLTSSDIDQQAPRPALKMLPMSIGGVGNYQELQATRQDGTSFDAELTVSRIDHLSLFIVVIRDVSQRKNLQKKILEIASDEQRRIGQELHDGTQQELTGLSLIAGSVENFLNEEFPSESDHQESVTLDQDQLSRLKYKVSKLVQGLQAAYRHVQVLSHGIMPVQIDAQGLHSALTELAHDISIEDNVSCTFVHNGSLKIDANNVATHLYRITQEAVNNAQRHGAAKNIGISLSSDSHQILLEITDDGSGMNAPSVKRKDKLSRGAGLQIMEYRASVIGGNLSIVAGENKGTTVRCTIPK